MGRSLHNKIYLGRRTPLSALKRPHIMACLATIFFAGIATVMLKGL